jgi:hypothetical protein
MELLSRLTDRPGLFRDGLDAFAIGKTSLSR